MKHKALKISVISVLVATILLFATLSVCAYFSTRVYVYTENGQEVAQVGMNLQLLFGKLEPYDATAKPNGVKTTDNLKIPRYEVENGYVVYYDGVTAGQETYYDPTAPWGSAQNPYVISETRHLQNLSARQNVGYFDLLYIANNFANGDYQEGSASIPYFLICDVDGTPITIDGSELDSAIKPIGNAEHPFIGVIGGAFVTQTTTGTGDAATTTQHTTTVAGKTSEVSAIHNFKIQTNTNQTDVGLFGYVGYLGTEPANATAGATFSGVASVVQNILLSDVQVVVKNPTIEEVASELLGHVLTNHRYTFTGEKDSNGDPYTRPTNVPPHETHHIGIFAGHVSYAHAEYISVYYSDDDTCAIDLTHVKGANNETITTNYHSSTGIVGYMHNMNSTIKNSVDSNGAINGNCQISYGGISSSGVNTTPDSPGTGGGKEIGLGRGYVVARTLYEGYHFTQTNQGMFDRIWKYTINSKVAYGPMYYAEINGTTPSYKSQNGNKVDIAEDGTATEYLPNEQTKSYKTYAIRTPDPNKEGAYIYTFYNYVTDEGKAITSEETGSGVVFVPDTDFSQPAVNREIPQNIWQYVLQRVDAEGVPTENQGAWTWVDAVLVRQQADGSFALCDNMFDDDAKINKYPVTVNGNVATITGAYYANGDPIVIEHVFFLLNDGVTYSTTSTGDPIVPEFFQEKPLLVSTAKSMEGIGLCIKSTYSTISGSYFYDGVFTFALSSENDTIESTWENETPDKIVLGPTDANDWTDAPYDGFYGVVAYIKPITTQDELDTAIANGQQVFIGYHNNYASNNWYGQNLDLMSLLEPINDETIGSKLSDNFYKTSSNRKQFFSEADRDEIVQLMLDSQEGVDDTSLSIQYIDSNYESVDALIAAVQNGSVQVLDLESATNIEKLMSKYAIHVEKNGDTYAIYQITDDDEVKWLSILECRMTLGNIEADDEEWYMTLIKDAAADSFNNSKKENVYSIWSGSNKPNDENFIFQINVRDIDFGSGILGYLAQIAALTLLGETADFDAAYTYAWSTDATIHFDPNTGALLNNVSYTYNAAEGDETRYVNYDAEGPWFNGSETSSNIYFYTIEAMSTVKSGQVIFAPKDTVDADDILEFPADGFVLWPQGIIKEDGTYDGFDEIERGKVSTEQLNTTTTTATTTTGTVYQTFKLLSLTDLHEADIGWQDGFNNPLSNINLRKKFTMENAIKFGLSLHIPGFSNISFNSNSVIAPIGQGGELANIPKGGVSFRINETTTKGSSIYVIVSVPVSNFYDNLSSEESLYTNYDYYLGLWRIQDVGESTYNTFSQTTAIQKFELPRSRPYELGTTAANADHILVEYGDATYRCYLNGERVLIAYRFTVFEAGTYVLGTAVGTSSFNDTDGPQYPMEIIYCAADGTASEGRDGTSGSVTGSLDYVYDYNNKIIHVQDYAANEGPDSGQEDFNYYYSSHIITYTVNNTTTPVSQLKIYPYRFINNGKSTFSLVSTNQALIQGKHVGVDYDAIIEGTYGESSSP